MIKTNFSESMNKFYSVPCKSTHVNVFMYKMDPKCFRLLRIRRDESLSYTDEKENQIFLIYKEIQSGAVAKKGLPNT
jgi:hypothetical protein